QQHVSQRVPPLVQHRVSLNVLRPAELLGILDAKVVWIPVWTVAREIVSRRRGIGAAALVKVREERPAHYVVSEARRSAVRKMLVDSAVYESSIPQPASQAAVRAASGQPAAAPLSSVRNWRRPMKAVI